MPIKRVTVIKQNLIVILLMAVLFIVSATEVKADTQAFTIVGYNIMNERVQIGDVGEYKFNNEPLQVGTLEEHFIGIRSIGGLAVFENGETAIYQGWETYDVNYPAREESYEGYFQLTYSDGSTSMFKLQGTATSPLPWWFSHGRVWVQGTGEYINGSKRFEGIQGSLSFSGRGLSEYRDVRNGGDMYMTCTVTYTLPSK